MMTFGWGFNSLKVQAVVRSLLEARSPSKKLREKFTLS
jgi:hypothetical protein